MKTKIIEYSGSSNAPFLFFKNGTFSFGNAYDGFSVNLDGSRFKLHSLDLTSNDILLSVQLKIVTTFNFTDSLSLKKYGTSTILDSSLSPASNVLADGFNIMLGLLFGKDDH